MSQSQRNLHQHDSLSALQNASGSTGGFAHTQRHKKAEKLADIKDAANTKAKHDSQFIRQLDRWDPQNEPYCLYAHENQYNYWSTDRFIGNDRALEHYEHNLVPKKVNFDFNQLPNPLRATFNLKSATLRRQKFRNQIDNRKRYKAWKKSQLYNKRKLRIHRRQYKSGIIGIDNPLNKDSKIYSNAAWVSQNLAEQKEENDENRAEWGERTNTSEYITFNNPYPRDMPFKRQDMSHL